MRTARPLNPFPTKEFIDKASGIAVRDDLWAAWEWGRREMDEYYREALQDPIGLLMSAEGELAGLCGGGTGNLHLALHFVRAAKYEIGKAVNPSTEG